MSSSSDVLVSHSCCCFAGIPKVLVSYLGSGLCIPHPSIFDFKDTYAKQGFVRKKDMFPNGDAPDATINRESAFNNTLSVCWGNVWTQVKVIDHTPQTVEVARQPLYAVSVLKISMVWTIILYRPHFL